MNTSLRRRIVLGALLWSVGLFVVAGAGMVALVNHHADYATAIHVALSHAPFVFIVSAVCLGVGLWYVRRGLTPVGHLRTRLAAVHAGREARVSGDYPAEIQPLVDDVNALLAHQEETVRRAVAKAGDLAHGLKTPLALLASEADRAANAGHAELAAAIAQHIDRMRRQIDHHLAHARAAASGATPGVRTSLAESAQGLARALNHLYSARALHLDVDVHDQAVRVTREDLDEMLGNLLDNACKWAKSRVRVSSSCDAATLMVEIVVEDDGAGLAAELREKVLQRGVRADEAAPGSGFGLAIARDLADVYGGRVTLDASSLGGLRARLSLPAATEDAQERNNDRGVKGEA
jgi:signal transduction histidine kinase